jgi:hypothetical protein
VGARGQRHDRGERVTARIVSAAALPALAVVATLTGCASLSERECRNADWYAIGTRDGRNGADAGRIAEHEKACAELGIQPDRTQWAAGRADGLAAYCTPRRGFDVGESGGVYGGVCGPETEPAFLRAYDLGRELADARARLETIDRELAYLDRALADAERRGDAQAARYLQGRLAQAQYERLQERMRHDAVSMRIPRSW